MWTSVQSLQCGPTVYTVASGGLMFPNKLCISSEACIVGDVILCVGERVK